MSSNPNAVSFSREFMIVRSRVVQILGLLVALTGLAGFWLTRDVVRADLTQSQCQMLGMADNCEGFRASFVVAGRDIFYEADKSTPVYNKKGEIIAWDYSGQRTANGTQTDTILYVNIIGNDITAIALPRDIYLPELDRRINTVYAKAGGEGLKQAVESILGLPIDYYAVINTDIFKDFVDELGGVEVNIKEAMDYDDNAGNLHIHFDPGLQTLDGENAVKFVRFRHTARGDYDRLDNVKTLGYAMLHKAQAMNVGAAFKLPELLDVLFKNVETNATPALVSQLTTRLSNLKLEQTATLPTFEEGRHVSYNVEDVETFIAQTFGGEARTFEDAPELTLLITNRSGVDGLAERYKERLETMGIPEESILITEENTEPTASRLLATTETWQDAEYFASLLQIGKQQIDHLDYVDGEEIGLELVLGEDAGESLFATQRAKQDVLVTSTR
jgi:polyisoprenyl-teichoic acid--peptidoglycan teichoic acid transferase